MGAQLKRFDYMDRMDEDELDDVVSGRERAEAYKKCLSPIEPDRTVRAKDGSEVSVYLVSKAREIMERQKEAYRISREGAR